MKVSAPNAAPVTLDINVEFDSCSLNTVKVKTNKKVVLINNKPHFFNASSFFEESVPNCPGSTFELKGLGQGLQGADDVEMQVEEGQRLGAR